MILLNIILNAVSPQLKKQILDSIKGLSPSTAPPFAEWDDFAIRLLHTLFDIKD